ncbi:hypothetical protein D7V91_01510 [bacterium 1xD42-67]|nr:hypothetical protein D7V91_01510 [bacterium 1xD42-67]
MTGRAKFRLKKKQPLWALPILAAVLAVLCISFGPSSRSAMKQYLRERYGREFVILSSEKVPRDLLGHRVYSARTFTAAPKDDPDLRFFASSYWATDGFWPVIHHYCNDSYEEEQMLRIWEEEARTAGVDYSLVLERYPCSREAQTFRSGYGVILSFGPKDLDQICLLLSRSMERMLAETPAQQGRMTGSTLRLRYREEDWPEDNCCTVALTLFYSLFHTGNGASEWQNIDTDPEAIRECILEAAARYERQYDLQ